MAVYYSWKGKSDNLEQTMYTVYLFFKTAPNFKLDRCDDLHIMPTELRLKLRPTRPKISHTPSSESVRGLRATVDANIKTCCGQKVLKISMIY